MDTRTYFIVSVAIVAILTGAWLTWRVLTPPPELATATLLPAAPEVAEFELVDQDDEPFTRADFEEHWNLVFFGFTNCPDICPLTLQTLHTARKQMVDEGQDVLPRIVLVSVDPERDTPARMAQYVQHFGDETIGLTGDEEGLRRLTESIGIFFEKSGDEGDEYTVDHSAVVVVIDPQARFRALFRAPHEAEAFVHDMPILVGAN